mmetsp:Transcript_14067/g.21236  ORF Transcript_14067/g.21236 Transcript_14067/m.21236 type:complete len:161 (-) Transcript_14067:1006-1488(-)
MSSEGGTGVGHSFIGNQLEGGNDEKQFEFREQDRLLPIANIARIMKQRLPPNAKISKEAKETVQECVSEFISFVTSEASDKCRADKRKTVNGGDIVWALKTLGFDEYCDILDAYLAKYREVTKSSEDVKRGTGTGGASVPSSSENKRQKTSHNSDQLTPP